MTQFEKLESEIKDKGMRMEIHDVSFLSHKESGTHTLLGFYKEGKELLWISEEGGSLEDRKERLSEVAFKSNLW